MCVPDPTPPSHTPTCAAVKLLPQLRHRRQVRHGQRRQRAAAPSSEHLLRVNAAAPWPCTATATTRLLGLLVVLLALPLALHQLHVSVEVLQSTITHTGAATLSALHMLTKVCVYNRGWKKPLPPNCAVELIKAQQQVGRTATVVGCSEVYRGGGCAPVSCRT